MSDDAVAALRAGQLVVLPTDTVYGICADAYREAPCLRLRAAKPRPEAMPVALLAADFDVVLDAVPEARGRAAVIARALLPGPYTLVLPNPARRFRWLSGARPTTIGVRVPALPRRGARGRHAGRRGRRDEREPSTASPTRRGSRTSRRSSSTSAARSSTRASSRARRRR